MKKSLFVTIPTLALMMLGAVACGGNNNSTKKESTGSQPQPSGTTVDIKVGVDSDNWVTALNTYFTDNPINGIRVTAVNEGASGAADKITTDQAAMPDIQLVVDGEVTRNAASLASVGAEIETKLAANAVERFVTSTTVNGEAKYVPMGYDGMVFGYNKTMLKSFGINVDDVNDKGLPKELDTFEEIFALAQKWATEGYPEYAGNEITTAVSLVAGNSWSGYAYVSAGGWKILSNKNDVTDAGFGTPEFKAGLEFIAAAADAKVKVQKAGTAYELAPSASLSQEQSGDLLNNRTSPMALVGTWENVAGCTAIQENDEIVFAAMPTWNGNQPGPFIKSKGFVINGYSANVAAAKVVLNKLYSAELMQIMLDNSSMPAVLKTGAEFTLNLTAIQQAMINAFQYGYSEVNTAMPNNPAKKAMDAYYGISPENFYKQVWDEAAANTGDAREAWLNSIIGNMQTAYNSKLAELNVAPTE